MMEERLLQNYEELGLNHHKKNLSMGSFHNIASIQTSRTILANAHLTHAGPTPELTTYGNIKLGWIQGVLIPCLLNIWGVMLFLRMAWIVAQAGIGLSILIIFISGVVCVITTLSLSAICTNGEIQGGGVYFLVSRSLGAELGASVGIIFAFANAVAASMNTIGFCDSLNEVLKSYNVKIIDNGPNDVRIIGAIALLTMCVICAIGMDWETKTQNMLITIIVTAIANFIIGAAIGPRSEKAKAEGFVGISIEHAKVNWVPDFRYSEGAHHDFFSVFSIYFPAVTGVQAGANICGDLRDPATAIPKGTLLALAISITSYLTMAILSGMGALRDATGSTEDLAKGTIDSCKPNCEYGLHHNYEIMHLMAAWGPLIYAGCWAATLSTALTNLLSVPRLIQALGFDRIYPGLIFFSKRYGAHGEPYRGYVLTFLVSASFLLIADLNTIAPLITNFYLASYALINFCTFHAAFFKPISWRPRFRFYNTWLSLTGCLLCVAIMMVISWVMALLTTFIFITLYLLVLYRKPETSWGGSTDAQRYQETIASILHMCQRADSIKSFNPQLLVMSGMPDSRPWLIDVGGLITKVGSFMIVADIEREKLTPYQRHHRRRMAETFLRDWKLRAFYVLMEGFEYEKALQGLLQAAGLGRVAPNVLLLGYKYNWNTRPNEQLITYYRMIRLAFEFQLAVSILRVPPNMRPPKKPYQAIPTDSIADMYEPEDQSTPQSLAIMQIDSDPDLDRQGRQGAGYDDENKRNIALTSASEKSIPGAISPKRSHRSSVSGSGRKTANYRPLIFNGNCVLDAWWLYDDGGMNILLPYIIARRASKEKMSLRIFALSRARQELTEAEKHMAELLKKFRIEYSQLTMVSSIGEPPSDTTWTLFHNILKNHRTSKDDEILVSESEANRLHEKTSRHLRLRELLIEHSFGSDFIVMTLPLPRKGISASMYMAWLEVMSYNMPPILFVRGNSTAVIE